MRKMEQTNTTISEPYAGSLALISVHWSLFSSPRTRVIGVDGKIGAMIEQALESCADGWVPAAGCR